MELVFMFCLNCWSCCREDRYILLLWVVGDCLLLFIVVFIFLVGWGSFSSITRSGSYLWLSDIISLVNDFESEALLTLSLRRAAF